MKLVPFFLQIQKTSTLTVYRLSLFLLDGGKCLWDLGSETDLKQIQQEFLIENGFYPLSLFQWKDILFAPLDPLKTKRSSFYSWEELQDLPEKRREDCFRTYVFCLEQPQDKPWFRSDFCEHPFDGRTETPTAIFQGLKNQYIQKIG